MTTFKEALEVFNKSEGVAVCVITYFLDFDAKDAYQIQVSPSTRVEGLGMAMTWPHVVHMLLQRYLTDEGFQKTHDLVTRAAQKDGEDELAFYQRIMNAARMCRRVLNPAELVQNFDSGLQEAKPGRIKGQMKYMRPKIGTK